MLASKGSDGGGTCGCAGNGSGACCHQVVVIQSGKW